MNLKCAHPDCPSDFDFTKGRLFRFQQTPHQEKHPTHWHGLKHYWLCARCCKEFTIEYQKGLGVLLLQRLDTITDGQPCYCVLQAEIAPQPARRTGSSARRMGHRQARHRRVKVELKPVPLSAIEILETRNV